MSNLPLPDQLADVRQRIKALEEQEAALKGQLLAHPELRTGASWAVEVKEIETTRVDLKELRAMHEDLVAEYTFPQKTVRLELFGISGDGELIPSRKYRKEKDEALHN